MSESSGESGQHFFLFKNVKFKLSGIVSESVSKILQEGGAECSRYFSDYVTHCIVGEDASETDISDAKELYEIPAVNVDWVLKSQKCSKLLPTEPFSADEEKIFSGVRACLSQLSKEDCLSLWGLITYHGGVCSLKLDHYTTHLVVGAAEGAKYEHAMKNLSGCSALPVTPDWVSDCVAHKQKIDETAYHPRLIVVPQPEKKLSDLTGFSTAHITGFADDDITAKDESETLKVNNELLEQLKQRMPWNQPQATSTAAVSLSSSLKTIVSSEIKEEPSPATSTGIILQQTQVSQNLIQIPNKVIQGSLVMQQPQQKTHLILQHHQQGLTQQRMQLAQHWKGQLIQQGQQPVQQQVIHQRVQLSQQPGLSQGGVTLGTLQQGISQAAVLSQQAGLAQQAQLGQQAILSQHGQQTIVQQSGLLQQPAGLTHQQVMGHGGLMSQQTGSQQTVFAQPTTLIQQQNTMLLSPQGQHEGQFIVSQPAQSRPQQIIHQQKSLGQTQQFIIREGPSLGQQPTAQFTWQQQQFPQNRQIVSTTQGPQQVQQRQITWMQQAQPQGGTRQLIQLDPHTHAHLQQLEPAQRALFLQRLQKQRQQVLQKQLQSQQQGRVVDQGQLQFGIVRTGQPQVQPGQGQGAVIRSQVSAGLSPQHQLQWIQQQRQNQILLQNRQQLLVQQQASQTQPAPQQIIRAPGGTVQAVQHQRMPLNVAQAGSQAGWQADSSMASLPVAQVSVPAGQQQQIANIRQQQLQLQRLQQLQKQQGVQRMAHYTGGASVPLQPSAGQPAQQHQEGEAPELFSPGGVQQQSPGVVVNKTKTALANMLSVRLQGAGTVGEGSAAGQLRLMTAQHQAAALPPPPPPQTTPAFQRAAAPVRPEVKPAAYAQTAARVAAVLAKSASGTPPANIHNRAQFFGHNPNLKLPPKMFLLGCVFLIMEYDRDGYDGTMWRRIILENGGETELSYSLKVTHIICQTQKHPLVQQGIRDGKRCVTAEWLSDTMIKQQVGPPWHALHFPTPFSDEKPCRNMIICHSGFEGDERVRIKKMIEAVGAKMTSYYTSHNNILVVRRPEGEKYKKAREWGKSVVNVQWLNEVLFGHYSCLQHSENQKYQQFNVANPFKVDYTLVTHLMGAWKVPIQVTQECFERAKASGFTGPKAKRPRLSTPEDSGDQENSVQFDPNFPPAILHLAYRPVVMFSGASFPTLDDEKKVLHLGGIIARNCREVTHLVMYKVSRTFKLLCCLSTARHIVTLRWLNDSFTNNRFQDEAPYTIDDPDFEATHKCNILKILSNPERSRLFYGRIFYVTPGVIPTRPFLAEMIHCAGGIVEKQRRSLKSIQEMESNSYIVVTCFEDFHLISDLMRINFGVYCTEFIMASILSQRIQFETVFRKSDVKNKI